jgi:hypothetical protein
VVLAPTAVVDTYAMTASDVTAVLDVLPEVPTVVLSSQDMYRRTPDPGPSGAKRQYRLLRTLRLVPVPDQALASDLVVTGAPAQHLLVSVHCAGHLRGWSPADPGLRVAESVRWHLANPPDTAWTAQDTHADDVALSAT